MSGCACAGALASRGVPVMLLSGALDSVGRPQFGPVVSAKGGLAEIAEVLGQLPKELREVWSDAAMVAEGAGFLIVDRRMVSVETKRRLEGMPGLEFRQGIACEVVVRGGNGRGSDGGRRRVVVETGFGEALQATAAVLAVGLDLGGEVSEQRAGKEEIDSERRVRAGLQTSLERVGVELVEVSVIVGPSVALEVGAGENAGMKSEEVVGGAEQAEQGETVVRVPVERVVARKPSEWPGDWPLSPLWCEDLWPKTALVGLDAGPVTKPRMSPDGVVTGEWYVGAEAMISAKGRQAEDGGKGKPVGGAVTRMGEVRRGLVACNVDEAGRLQGDRGEADAVWITGRAAGARSYLESLAAGVRTGAAVAEALGVGG